ncbi:hypothetical protein BH09PLA1_BH09PLA1_24910 [soil metagenome]
MNSAKTTTAKFSGSTTRTQTRRRRAIQATAILAAACVSHFAPKTAMAQVTSTWTFNGNSNWGTASNWASNLIPNGGGVANFNTTSTAQPITVSLDIAATLQGLSFATSGLTNVYTISDGGGGLTLSGAGTISVASGTTGAINALIGGSVGLTKQGTGTLFLGNSSNNYTGTTNIQAGTLQLTANNVLNSTSINFASSTGGTTSGGTLNIGATNQTVGGFNYVAPSGTGTLISGTGVVTLSGDITSTVSNSGFGWNILTPITLSGATRTINIISNSNGANDLIFNAAVTGTSNLVKSGTGGLNFLNTAGWAGNFTINGGTTNFALAATYTGSTTVNGGTVIYASSASYTGATTLNAGTMVFNGAASYTGATTINSGSFVLQAAAGALTATSGITLNGGSLNLVNTITNNSNRIFDSAPISLSGGSILFSAAVTGGISEAMGAVSVDGASSALSLASSATAGNQTRVNISNFTRTNRATALVRGSSLGQGTSATYNTPTTGNSYLKFNDSTNEATFVGTLAGTAAATYTSTTTNLPIVPYLIGDTSGTGTGNTFLTYVGTNGIGGSITGPGFVALATGNYATAMPGAVTDNNIRLSTAGFALTPTAGTMNSLLAVSGGTFSGTALQTIASGALASLSSGSFTINTPMQFGTGGGGNREAIVSVLSAGSMSLLGAVTTSQGLTKAGAGLLILGADNNATLVGDIVVNAGSVQFTADNNLGASANVVRLSQSAGLSYAGSADLTIARQISAQPTSNAILSTINVVNAFTLTLSTRIAGANANTGFTKTGAGSLTAQLASSFTGLARVSAGFMTLTGDNTNSSATTDIFGGSLRVDNDTNFPTGPALLDGGTLLFVASGTYAKPMSHVFSSFIDTGANTVTMSGVISSTGSTLSKQGAAALTLSGNNTYTGITAVNAGTLTIASGATQSGGGSYTVASGAALRVSGTIASSANTVAVTGRLVGDGTINRPITVASGGIVEPGASVGILTATSLSLSGSILNYESNGTILDLINLSGALTLGTSSTVNLSGAGLATGNYVLINATGGVTGSAITIGTNTLGGGFDYSLLVGANTVTLKIAPPTVDYIWDFDPSDQGPAAPQDGSGSWDTGITNNFFRASDTSNNVWTNSFSNSVTFGVTGGSGGHTVTIATAVQAKKITFAQTYTINGAAMTLDVGITANADATVNSAVTMNSSNTFDVASTKTLTMTGGVGQASAGLSLNKAGAGVLLLSGASSYTGATNITAGILRLGAADSIPDASIVSVTGSLDLNGFDETIGGLSGAGGVTLGAKKLTVNQAGNTSYTGAMTGTGGQLAKGGAGNLSLGGANAFTGGSTINAGTVSLTVGTAMPTGGAVTVNDGGAFDIAALSNATGTAIGALTLNGTGLMRVPSGSGDYWAASLTQTGGALNYSGAGAFWLHLTTAAGITTNASSTTALWDGGGSTSPKIQNETANPMTVNVAAGTTPSGIDLDAGVGLGTSGLNTNWNKTGPGTMRLTVASSPNLTVSDGVLRADLTANIPTGTTFALNGGTFLYGGATGSIARTVAVGGASPNIGTISVQNATPANLTDSSLISGTGTTLRKVGNGTLTLSATNTMTGLTDIREGAINLTGTGSLSSDVNVQSGTFFDVTGRTGGDFVVATGKKLSGGGVVKGAVTISGTVSPGGSAGSISLNGATTLATGGAYDWEINSQSGGPGIGWDKMNLDAVTVTATPGGFTIKIISLNGSNQPGPTPGWSVAGTPGTPQVYTIATSSNNSFTAAMLDKFTVDTSQFQNDYPSGWSMAIGNSGGSLDLVYIPEPSSALVMLAMAGGAMIRRRRRSA